MAVAPAQGSDQVFTSLFLSSKLFETAPAAQAVNRGPGVNASLNQSTSLTRK